ncbi:MAG: hypothetical protein PXX83_04710 [Candidatus Nitrosotalea sp.]|nr:hypothetical protein [Candidatus Nitrosotalea sp.]
MDDIILNIPVSVGISLAGYFHPEIQNGKTLQKTIERQGDFRINRRGFATNVIKMIPVLLQYNLVRLTKLEDGNNVIPERGRGFNLSLDNTKVVLYERKHA